MNTNLCPDLLVTPNNELQETIIAYTGSRLYAVLKGLFAVWCCLASFHHDDVKQGLATVANVMAAKQF